LYSQKEEVKNMAQKYEYHKQTSQNFIEWAGAGGGVKKSDNMVIL
jgi:hypothetical protein